MKNIINIHKGDEYMDMRGELRIIRIIDKHFDDYEVEELIPTWDEETDEEISVSYGTHIMAASDLKEIVKAAKGMSEVSLVYEG